MSIFYAYFFVYKALKKGYYKKFEFSIDLPLKLFILYSLCLFIPSFHETLKYSEALHAFNELWVKLGFIKENKIKMEGYRGFHYYQGLLSLLTLFSSYLFFHLVFLTRKEIKKIYQIFFVIYTIFLFGTLIVFLLKIDFSVLINPNHRATLISLPLPILFYKFYIKEVGKKVDISQNLMKLCYLIFIFFTLYTMNARIVILSVIIILGAYFFVERKKVSISMILGIFSLLLTVSILIFFNKGILDTDIFVWDQIKNSGSLELRSDIWNTSLNIFKDYPIFGVGPGQFSLVYPFYSKGNEYIFIHHAHNDYLQFLVEYGIVGVFLLIFVYFRSILFIKSSLKRLKGNSLHLFIATLFSILMFHIQIFTGFQAHIGIFIYIIVFLVASLYLIVYNFDRYYKSNNDELL